jgi:hypothetical protein
MTSKQIMARVEPRFPEIVKRAYAAIDAELAGLLERAETMPIAVFYREVEAAIERVPLLYPLLDSAPISDELETAMGEAIIGGIISA